MDMNKTLSETLAELKGAKSFAEISRIRIEALDLCILTQEPFTIQGEPNFIVKKWEEAAYRTVKHHYLTDKGLEIEEIQMFDWEPK